jgi:glycosyltransferase involved in cell wall biosynthesis
LFEISKISILIPYQPSNKVREYIFNWLVKFYKHTLPEAEICIGYTSTKHFSRSLAINNASKKATGDIFVILDADIICSPHVIRKAANSLNHSAWIIPYTEIEDISRNSTVRLLNNPPEWPLIQNIKTTKRVKGGIRVGGINILKRDSFIAVGGFDERFRGWGGEDGAFQFAMDTICGNYRRFNQSVYHLWHPPAKARSNPYYDFNFRLANRYFEAKGNIQAMLEIIEENKDLKQ